MDDKKLMKDLSFRDFVTVDYTMTDDEYLAYQAQKRRRGHFDTWGDDYTPEEGEQLDEVLSTSQRIKASQRMKKMSRRIQVAKKRAMKRAPSADVLKKRARKQAKDQMIKKWTRGVPKSELSLSRRAELEKKLKKSSSRIDRMSKRLVPQVRKQDRERRAAATSKKSNSEK